MTRVIWRIIIRSPCWETPFLYITQKHNHKCPKRGSGIIHSIACLLENIDRLRKLKNSLDSSPFSRCLSSSFWCFAGFHVVFRFLFNFVFWKCQIWAVEFGHIGGKMSHPWFANNILNPRILVHHAGRDKMTSWHPSILYSQVVRRGLDGSSNNKKRQLFGDFWIKKP